MTASQRVASVLDEGVFTLLPEYAVLEVTGKDAFDLLQRLTTNDLTPTRDGTVIETAFLSPTGRTLYRVLMKHEDERILLLGEPHAAGGLAEWVDRYTFIEDCKLTLREDLSVLLVLGAASQGEARDDQLRLDARFGCVQGAYLIAPSESLVSSADELREQGVPELSEAELLQLRVEAGRSAEGHELTEDYHALESGLEPIISFTKGCYPGQEVVARQDSRDKVLRTLVGLVFEGTPKEGEDLSSENKKACRVTSVAPAAPLDLPQDYPAGPACLGYVKVQNAVEGKVVTTDSGLSGRVVLLPFPRYR